MSLLNFVLHTISLYVSPSLWFQLLLSLVIIMLLMLLYCTYLDIVTFYSDYLSSTSGPSSLVCPINESHFRLTYTPLLQLFFTDVSNLYSFKEILISPGNEINCVLPALCEVNINFIHVCIHSLYFNDLIVQWISTTLFFQITCL
jgi:hypothetical protein